MKKLYYGHRIPRLLLWLSLFLMPTIGRSQALEPFSLGATEIIFTWTSDTETDPALYFDATANPQATYYGNIPTPPSRYHYYHLTDLTPETTYSYYTDLYPAIGQSKTFSLPAGEYLGRIAIITDNHLSLGHTDSEKILSRSAEILSTALNQIADQKCDLVIINGDLTDHSKPDQWDQLKEILENSPLPVCPLLGNHDKYSEGWQTRFTSLLSSLTEKNLLPCQYSDTHATYLFKAKWLFVLLDSANAETGLGDLNEAAFDFLEQALIDHLENPTLLFFHHLFYQYPFNFLLSDFPLEIPQSDDLSALLKNYPALKAVFSGHAHLNWIFEKNGVYNIVNSALIQFPISYHLVDLYEYGFIKTLHKIPQYLPEDDQSAQYIFNMVEELVEEGAVPDIPDAGYLALSVINGFLTDRSLKVDFSDVGGEDISGDIADEDQGDTIADDPRAGEDTGEGGDTAADTGLDGGIPDSSEKGCNCHLSPPSTGWSNGLIGLLFWLLFGFRKRLSRSRCL